MASLRAAKRELRQKIKRLLSEVTTESARTQCTINQRIYFLRLLLTSNCSEFGRESIACTTSI